MTNDPFNRAVAFGQALRERGERLDIDTSTPISDQELFRRCTGRDYNPDTYRDGVFIVTLIKAAEDGYAGVRPLFLPCPNPPETNPEESAA